MSAPFQYPVKKLVITSSMLGSNGACARYFELSSMFGQSSKKKSGFAADVGTALHRAFQTYLMEKSYEAGAMALLLSYPYDLEEEKYENATRSLEAAYGTYECMVNEFPLTRYELATIRTQETGNPLRKACEVPFVIALDGLPGPLPCYFSSLVDLVVYDTQEEKYIILDIKTTRLSAGDLTARYQFDMQLVPYGIILSAMQGDMIEEFTIGYMSVYIDLVNPRVQFYIYDKHATDIREWMEALKEMALRYLRYTRRQHFPRAASGHACFSYNSPCFHSGICGIDNKDALFQYLEGEVWDGYFREKDLQPWFMTRLDLSEIDLEGEIT